MRIGILGGGQLGKYLVLSAERLGIESIVFTDSNDCCSEKEAKEVIYGNFLDDKKIEEFAKKIDIVVYEFENIPVYTVKKLLELGKEIPQGIDALNISQNRIREKNLATELGIRTTKYIEIKKRGNFKEKIKEFGFPSILKSCEGGYDGKGQWVLNSVEDIPEISEKRSYILEKQIEFDMEVSIMMGRDRKGNIVSYPLAKNSHKDGILSESIIPSGVDEKIENIGKEIGEKIIERISMVGILGIEFFLKGENLYFNEMAPRPHNSFHGTLDGFDKSQFDILIETIIGLDITQPKLIKNIKMINILGEDSLENYKVGKLYLYGKKEWKKRRKMGHINIELEGDR